MLMMDENSELNRLCVINPKKSISNLIIADIAKDYYFNNKKFLSEINFRTSNCHNYARDSTQYLASKEQKITTLNNFYIKTLKKYNIIDHDTYQKYFQHIENTWAPIDFKINNKIMKFNNVFKEQPFFHHASNTIIMALVCEMTIYNSRFKVVITDKHDCKYFVLKRDLEIFSTLNNFNTAIKNIIMGKIKHRFEKKTNMKVNLDDFIANIDEFQKLDEMWRI